MHDPMVVAFGVPRPWPARRQRPLLKTTPRWSFRRHHWTLAGRLHLYWPDMIVVWHVEPGGRDSGEVCKHYRRQQRPDGTWETTVLHGWRWHVWHWRVQIPAPQELRRWALTRCAWCAGPSRKRNKVNVSHSWDGPRGRWWQGAPGRFHADCSSAHTAARSCTCDAPILDHDGWGTCARCGLGYGYGRTEGQTRRYRLLKTVPAGQRPSAELMAQVRADADAEREGAAS